MSLQEFDVRKNAILDAEYAPPSASPANGGVVATAPRPGTELGLMTGQEIGPQNRRYRLERIIATGGMGQVWQATDLATHAELGSSEMVALKILPPALTQSATHAKLLVEEATQARKLAHENIVRVYEWALDPATASYFIIMECLDGQDLEQYLDQHGPLPLARVLDLLRPVAGALSYAWDKHRLVHRDIKPGNVFLTQRGEVKLLDFGIAARARNAGSSLGTQTPNAGTDGYRAPEAGTHQRQPSPRLDVYAVAAMIYQMLEGRVPFEARRGEQLPSAPAGLNAGQWQVLQNGFAADPEQRPLSVQELLDTLQRADGPSAQELEQVREQEQEQQREQQRAAALAEQARLSAQASEDAAAAELAATERAAAAEQARQLEQQRQRELAVQRKAAAQAAALEQVRLEALRKEAAARQRIADEAARKARKEVLREQLRARREEDAAKALQQKEEQQQRARQIKAELLQRAEQERARQELAARSAAELARLLPSTSSPVADQSGVLRDRFLDGSGSGPDLVLIPTGRFQMGGQAHEHKVALDAGSQRAWLERELPLHWVGIEHSFALGCHPVSVGQWRRFVAATGWQPGSDTDWDNPGFTQTDEHPVVGVSWNDAQLYLSWLSDQTGQTYRLPTEAEWEYACRAGTRTAFHFGDTINTEQANYDGSYIYNNGPRGQYRGGTTRQGTFPANPWGLYDMHGNVWEWVQDRVHDNYDGAPQDGSAWEKDGDKSRRVLRGGSWLYNPRYLRAALRNGYSAVLSNDIVGFRVARQLV